MAAIVVVFSTQYVHAQDAAQGRELYETHCGDCHFQRVHERDRDKSRVQTREQLRVQVARWGAQTRRNFSAQEQADMVEYLDRSHYRLEK